MAVMRLHVFLYLFIAACARHAGRAVYDSPSGNTPQIDVGRDSVVRLHHSQWSGMDSGARLVLKDSVSWSKVWASLQVNTIPPEIDFSHQMVILAALGSRTSGGYEITIDSVRPRRSEFLIFVRTTEPGEECGAPATMTQPVDVVAVPWQALPTRFIEFTEVHRC
jgi:protease stability complex PrcB-like protein